LLDAEDVFKLKAIATSSLCFIDHLYKVSLKPAAAPTADLQSCRTDASLLASVVGTESLQADERLPNRLSISR
jgi:hypothetical protein